MDVSTFFLVERIFNTVFPLAAIVLVGLVYARRFKPDMKVANQANLDIFVPALVFSVMSASSFQLGDYTRLALGCAGVVLGSGLLLWLPFRWFGLSSRAYLPPMMFSNSGNLGIPLILLAFGESALPAAIVLFIVSNFLHFTVGIYLLDRHANLQSMLRNPIILAALGGMAWSLSGWTLPASMQTLFELLGQISVPLMLFALGVRMNDVDFSQWRIGLIGGMLCPLSGVAAALAIQPLLQLEPAQFAFLLLFSALPPAVLNYMLSEKYQQAPQEVASIVLLGNMASLLVIPAVLAIVL